MNFKIICQVGIICLLALCFFRMPYSYYQAVKVVSFIGLGYLANEAYKGKKYTECILLAIGAVIFNPLFKLHFERGRWQVIDGVMIAVLLGMMVKDARNIKVF